MFLFALSMLYCAWTVKIVQFMRNRTRNLVVNTFHHQAELAKKLAEAKEEFSANMSHEVRRLISNISPRLRLVGTSTVVFTSLIVFTFPHSVLRSIYILQPFLRDNLIVHRSVVIS